MFIYWRQIYSESYANKKTRPTASMTSSHNKANVFLTLIWFCFMYFKEEFFG